MILKQCLLDLMQNVAMLIYMIVDTNCPKIFMRTPRIRRQRVIKYYKTFAKNAFYS